MTHVAETTEIARMRWRCRRGLLELDLVMQPFVDCCYAQLSEAQKREFDRLLDLPDTILWDRITGRQAAEDLAQQDLLALINKNNEM